MKVWFPYLHLFSYFNSLFHSFETCWKMSLMGIPPDTIGNGRVTAYSHNRLALDHFFATRPDSHSTISIIAWYLTLKNWNFSVCTRISTRNLTIFEPTRPDLTRPFDTRSDSYSTNLPLAHSLWNFHSFIFPKRKSRVGKIKIRNFNFFPTVPIILFYPGILDQPFK